MDHMVFMAGSHSWSAQPNDTAMVQMRTWPGHGVIFFHEGPETYLVRRHMKTSEKALVLAKPAPSWDSWDVNYLNSSKYAWETIHLWQRNPPFFQEFQNYHPAKGVCVPTTLDSGYRFARPFFFSEGPNSFVFAEDPICHSDSETRSCDTTKSWDNRARLGPETATAVVSARLSHGDCQGCTEAWTPRFWEAWPWKLFMTMKSCRPSHVMRHGDLDIKIQQQRAERLQIWSPSSLLLFDQWL